MNPTKLREISQNNESVGGGKYPPPTLVVSRGLSPNDESFIYQASSFPSLRQAIEGKRSNQVAPEATPAALNWSTCVGPGLRAAAEVQDRGAPSTTLQATQGGRLCLLAQLHITSVSPVCSSSMKNGPATGSDGVSIRILKLCFDAIGHVLLFILNPYFTTCVFS